MSEKMRQNPNGYDQYFKTKRQMMKKGRLKAFKRQAPQYWLIGIATLLAAGCAWYLLGGDQQAAQVLSRVEVNFLGEANAADGEKTADDKQKSEAKGSSDAGPDVKAT